VGFNRIYLHNAMLIVSLVIAVTLGCRKAIEVQDHSHGHHGGHMLKLSEIAEFELEFTVDERRKRMVVYVQEVGTHEPYALPTEKLIARINVGDKTYESTFEADPRPNDPPGSASRFFLSLEALPQQFLGSNEFNLKLYFTIDGKDMYAMLSHRDDHRHNYQHD